MASVFWKEQNCDVMDRLEMKKAQGETPGRRLHVHRQITDLDGGRSAGRL